jgi:hypothetical protein
VGIAYERGLVYREPCFLALMDYGACSVQRRTHCMLAVVETPSEAMDISIRLRSSVELYTLFLL